MNAINRLREVMRRAWRYDIDRDRTIDIDYDRAQDIDWADDFDPSEPRVPKGAPGGGQWTAGGGVAAGPSPALTKYAGPAGAKFKKLVDAHLHEMTNTTATPEQVEAKVKQLAADMVAEGGKFKSSNVAGYLNQLIQHLEAQHGYAPGTLGKAVKKKDDGLKIEAPSDEEIQKMAAAAGAPETNPPDEAELAATASALSKPAEPDMPPAGAHPNTQQIAEVMGNKWDASEKVAWIKALAGDIPPEDAGQAWAQAQIAKLEGGDVPATSGNLPQVPVTSGAPEPEAGPEPVLNSQKKVFAVYSNGSLSIPEKIKQIEAMVANYSHQPNIDYANTYLALLKKAQAEPAAPKEDEPTGPEPQTDIQKAIVAAAQTPGNSSAKFWAMQKVVQESGLGPDDASLKFAQQWANSLYGGAGSTLEPSSKVWSLLGNNQGEPAAPEPAGATMTPEEEAALLKKLPKPNPFKPTTQGQMWQIASDPSLTAEGKIAQIEQMKAGYALSDDQEYADKTIAALKGEPAAAAGPDLDKYMTGPGEQAALEKAIPMPGGPQAEQDLWETAAMKGWTAASKIKQLEADMEAGGIAEAGSSPQSKQTNAYAQSLIDFLKGYDLSKQPGPQLVQQPAPPADWPQAPGGIGGNTFIQKLAAMATNGSNTSAQLQDYFDNKLAMGDIFPDGEVANYTKKIIAWKQAQEGGTPTPAIPLTSNWPLPSNSPQQSLFNNVKNAATPLAQHQLLNSIATSIASPELKGYAKALKAALGPDPSATPAAPTAPTIPLHNNTNKQQSMYNIAVDPTKSVAEKINLMQGVGAFQDIDVAYYESIVAALGGAPATSGPGLSLTPTAPTIPLYSGNNTGKFKTIYNAATHPTQPLAQKIAAVQAVVMNTKAGGAYKLQVLAALNAAGPKKAPEPPPANLPQPAAGSNTQSLMYSVANQSETDQPPLNNEEKIAEITKQLANSSGQAGGKAETYANSLITALGGQATTKTAAMAANAPAATPITPSGPSTGVKQPPAGSSGGPPLRSANPKILARGEKIWNAAAKISGIKAADAKVVAPSLVKGFWNQVPGSTQQTIQWYVGSGSGAINAALRDPINASKSTSDQIHGIEDAFDLPEAKVTKDVIMTRGLNMDKAEIDKLKKYLELGLPSVYFMQGYGSSSMHPTTPAFDQKPVWLEMVVRKGTPALGVGAISTLGENELLLEHGQIFDVHEIREEGGKIKIRMVSRPPADTGDRAWRRR